MAVGESGTAGQQGRSRRAHGTSEPRLALVRRRREGAKGAAGRERAPVGAERRPVRHRAGAFTVERRGRDPLIGVTVAGVRMSGVDAARKQKQDAQQPRDPASDPGPVSRSWRAASHLDNASWRELSITICDSHRALQAAPGRRDRH